MYKKIILNTKFKNLMYNVLCYLENKYKNS